MAEAPAAGVVCARCGAPIVLKNAEKVAEEFAVACAKCGHRGIYRIEHIKTIEVK